MGKKIRYEDYPDMISYFINLAKSHNIDLLSYITDDFNVEQVKEVYAGLIDTFDVRVFSKSEYNADLMHLIRYCMMYGLPYEKYLDESITKEQASNILCGLKEVRDNHS